MGLSMESPVNPRPEESPMNLEKYFTNMGQWIVIPLRLPRRNWYLSILQLTSRIVKSAICWRKMSEKDFVRFLAFLIEVIVYLRTRANISIGRGRGSRE